MQLAPLRRPSSAPEATTMATAAIKGTAAESGSSTLEQLARELRRSLEGRCFCHACREASASLRKLSGEPVDPSAAAV